jgi:MoxR-like ATPase
MSYSTTGRNADVAAVRAAADTFGDNVGKVIVGKEEIIQLCFVSLLCEGHILVEDVPGIGKTTLARSIARSIEGTFRRVQCTPDLLPSDVTGIHYFNQKVGEFQFRPGPIMANVVLVDEINRATPRTQSCFLEAMQERQVTVDLETVDLPRPFLIIATQNPIELEGTFPLPEAQLDRFLIRLAVGYPSAEEEARMLERFQHSLSPEPVSCVLDGPTLIALQATCRGVYVDASLRAYISSLCQATRNDASVRLGASPRAALALQQTAQAHAATRGRDYVTPDDVKAISHPVLAHRLLMETTATLRGETPFMVIDRVLRTVPVPVD